MNKHQKGVNKQVARGRAQVIKTTWRATNNCSKFPKSVENNESEVSEIVDFVDFAVCSRKMTLEQMLMFTKVRCYLATDPARIPGSLKRNLSTAILKIK